MPWDNDHLVGDLGEISFRSADRSVNTAAGRVIDEGIVTIPPCVTRVEDVGIGEVHGYVAVGVSRRVVLKSNGSAIQLHRLLFPKHCRGNGSCRCGWKGEVQALDSCCGREMLARVLVGENDCARGVQPFVTVGVVKVPVGVDEVCNRVGTNPGESVGDLGACTRKTGVDEKFSVAAWEDGDISAGAHENADVSTQRLHGDGSACSL